jgi:hypothetical protein
MNNEQNRGVRSFAPLQFARRADPSVVDGNVARADCRQLDAEISAG